MRNYHKTRIKLLEEYKQAVLDGEPRKVAWKFECLEELNEEGFFDEEEEIEEKVQRLHNLQERIDIHMNHAIRMILHKKGNNSLDDKFCEHSINENLQEARRLLHILNKPQLSNSKIESAKQYPITEVIKHKKNKALCPFHADKDPSLQLYPETNTFYCWSCQSSGDVISLYQKVNSKDFKTTLEELSTV